MPAVAVGAAAAAVASVAVLASPPAPALARASVGREEEAGGSWMAAAGSCASSTALSPAGERRTGEVHRSTQVEAEGGGRRLLLLLPPAASAPAAVPAAAAGGIASADDWSATVIEVAVDGRVVADPIMPERTRADSSWSTVLPLALLLSAARRPEGRAAADPGRNGDPWVVLAACPAGTSPVGVLEGDGVAGVWPEEGVGSSRLNTALRAGGPAGRWDGGEERKGLSVGGW